MKTMVRSHFVYQNSTEHLEVNLGLRGEKPLTNQHLSYCQGL